MMFLRSAARIYYVRIVLLRVRCVLYECQTVATGLQSRYILHLDLVKSKLRRLRVANGGGGGGSDRTTFTIYTTLSGHRREEWICVGKSKLSLSAKRVPNRGGGSDGKTTTFGSSCCTLHRCALSAKRWQQQDYSLRVGCAAFQYQTVAAAAAAGGLCLKLFEQSLETSPCSKPIICNLSTYLQSSDSPSPLLYPKYISSKFCK